MPDTEKTVNENISAIHKELDILEHNLTHLGNAQRLVHHYKNRLKFDHIREKWFVWNGLIWEEDTNGHIFRVIEETNQLFEYQSSEQEDKKLRSASMNWVKSSRSFSNITATERLARSQKHFAVNGGWDNRPFLFAAKNGIINLKTGELIDGRPEDMLTIQSSVKYDPGAECPLWNKFIEEAFEGNEQVINYIQKALGYSLTGENKEQIIFIGYGSGSNGKSTMLRTLIKILGEYSYTAPRTTFQVNRYNDQTNDIAQLVSKRFVSWSETRMSASLDEEKLKSITGGENMRARFLHHEFFEFQPILKLWMFFNHKPIARDDSDGFWRRIRVIPFNHVFDGKDKDIDKKLCQELPGILTWLVTGCLNWQEQTLDPLPTIIKEATQIYREESDPIQQWINEKYHEDLQSSLKSSILYNDYKVWATSQGMDGREILSLTMFGIRMSAKFEKKPTRTGIYYVGLALNGE